MVPRVLHRTCKVLTCAGGPGRPSCAVDPSAVRANLREYLERLVDINAVYLFGSVARGDATAASDVDLGFLYGTAPAHTLADQPFHVEADLAALLGRQVQVIVLNDAPPDLVHRVLLDGELLLERDRGRRIAFEVASRIRYWDLLPVLKQYRQARS